MKKGLQRTLCFLVALAFALIAYCPIQAAAEDPINQDEIGELTVVMLDDGTVTAVKEDGSIVSGGNRYWWARLYVDGNETELIFHSGKNMEFECFNWKQAVESNGIRPEAGEHKVKVVVRLYEERRVNGRLQYFNVAEGEDIVDYVIDNGDTPTPTPDPVPTPDPIPDPTPDPTPVLADGISVVYITHVQSYGWETSERRDGEVSGTMGESKRLEAIKVRIEGDADLGICYTTHCQTYGWLPYSCNWEMNGTSGESKRLEAIKINLTGAHKDLYDVYYRVHAQSYGWLNWAKNGAPAGTAGQSKRLEGIQIVVVPKDAQGPVETFNGITSDKELPYYSEGGKQPVVGADDTDANDPQIAGAEAPYVVYQTHVQSYGWQAWKANGQMSGTSGESKRLEGIKIKLSNTNYAGGISYITHVQTYGWQGDVNNQATWKKDADMAGTSGESKRLESIQINLYGEMAEHYDVYYRVHAQTFGWLGWAKNGAPSGTAGHSKRLEGIQVVLVPKGAAGPDATYKGVTSTNDQPFIQ